MIANKIGAKSLETYQRTGKKLGRRDAILAKCCECNAEYIDGRQDCKIEGCPLYPYMPYKGRSE